MRTERQKSLVEEALSCNVYVKMHNGLSERKYFYDYWHCILATLPHWTHCGELLMQTTNIISLINPSRLIHYLEINNCPISKFRSSYMGGQSASIFHPVLFTLSTIFWLPFRKQKHSIFWINVKIPNTYWFRQIIIFFHLIVTFWIEY